MINPELLIGRLGNRLFQIAYLYSQIREGKIPDWFVQDYEYFEKCKDEIKKLFGDGIGYLPYVAVHLRVGSNPIDPAEPRYADNPFYVNLSKTGYYINATNLFPDRKFLVFSDDIEFAKTYFEGSKFAFDDSSNALEAVNKMASCDGIITANSSLSWWAAYLSPNRGQIVAPKAWFTDGKEMKCPPEWTRIN